MRRALPGVAVLALLALATPQAGAGDRRVRVEAEPSATLLVHGEYPERTSNCVNPSQPLLHARYRGTIEVGRDAHGSLFVIGELPFEDYLKGIAEVPRRWHLEALKAQVVAARSYAMSRLRLGSSEARRLGYDLCATEACQVYLGMGIEAGPWGERWVRAVEGTAGEVLLYEGRPADALYSSTSPGRTFDNEDVFGGSPLPYLRGGPERDDGESPLAHWEVRFALDDLARFLRAAGAWGGERIQGVTIRSGRIALRGGGRRLRLTRAELRSALNDVASCLDERYPSREPDGYRLPQTVPSVWFEAEREGDDLVLRGRGWGHGVGMVQWGAKGKADRGLGYGDILAAYYGGLRPQRVETPETIRVLVADGLRRVTVVPHGPATIAGLGRDVDPPWVLTARRRGVRVRRGPQPPPALAVEARRAALREGRLTLPIDLPKDARVRLELVDEDGRVTTTPWRPRVRGRHRLDETPPAGPGSYRVRVVADDGVDRIRRGAGTVVLAGAARPTEDPAPPPGAPGEPGRALPVPAVLIPLVAAVLGLGAWLTLRRRRGFHRG
ncbi:MAG TPA: SpoIID/LytB domain-containing protein [Actinomycetota bacterium]|nr:SpoIID/LytB domain-containing protein [Actinomycetota bacterium]